MIFFCNNLSCIYQYLQLQVSMSSMSSTYETCAEKRNFECMLGSSEWPLEAVEACMNNLTQDSSENQTYTSPNLPFTAGNLLESNPGQVCNDVHARPARAAKRRALANIQSIHRWENCSEASEMFQRVAHHVEVEFQSECLDAHERIHAPNSALTTQNGENGETSNTENSDAESMSESMKDFIVADSCDEDEEENSEASFKLSEEAYSELSDDADSDSADSESAGGDSPATVEEIDIFFANANDILDKTIG